jgi:lysophospholipase L1-like esterase
VHEKLPKTRIIFVSIKPGPARWKFRDKFAEANELIRIESQKDKRLAFVDVFKSMLEETGEPKKEIFLGDGIHLNREGYKIWREALAPHIRHGIKKNF